MGKIIKDAKNRVDVNYVLIRKNNAIYTKSPRVHLFLHQVETMYYRDYHGQTILSSQTSADA